jgi:hypothetical protein
MAALYEAFRSYGGIWIAILLALTWIAASQLSNIKDTNKRWVGALSQKWLMKTAICLGLGSWVWNFKSLYVGDAYLRGSGKCQELSTTLLGVILLIAGVAWWGTSWRRLRRFRLWWGMSWRGLHHFRLLVTHGLVLVLILSKGLLVKAPGDLSQETVNNKEAKDAVAFVQGRLTQLGCFHAVGVRAPREESFGALTASAVISFQSANNLLRNSEDDTGIGVIRSNLEFPLLTRPFPFLFGPERCPPP